MPLTIAAVFVPNEIAKVLLGITAFICFWGAAYIVWRREREARNESEAKANSFASRLLPRISFRLASKDGIWTLPLSNGSLSKWAQIDVTTLTDAPLIECEVWIMDVQRITSGLEPKSIMEEPARCQWSQAVSNEVLSLTVRPGVPRRANLLLSMKKLLR